MLAPLLPLPTCRRRPAQKLEIYTTLLREFARSRSSCDRLTFLQVCREVMAAFSGKFFRLYFLDPCVETVYDRVPNVRMELCSMLPQVKTFICLPQVLSPPPPLSSAHDLYTLCSSAAPPLRPDDNAPH